MLEWNRKEEQMGQKETIMFYHFSKYVIEKPVKDKLLKSNDLDKGFYGTLSIQSGLGWGNEYQICNIFELEKSDNVLDLFTEKKDRDLIILMINIYFNTISSIKGYNKVGFLEKEEYKKYIIDLDDYDYAITPRIDDKYLDLVTAVVESDIDFDLFKEVIYLSNREQIVVPDNYLDKLKFKGYKEIITPIRSKFILDMSDEMQFIEGLGKDKSFEYYCNKYL